MFENLINRDGMGEGTPRKITKAADAVEFEFRDGVLVRVEPDMDLMSPKPEDATVEPVHAASHFPTRPVQSAGDGHPDNVMPLDYEYDEPDPTSAGTAPSMLNFLNRGEDGNIPEPAEYSPSRPGRNPADGAKPVRMGDSYIITKRTEHGDEEAV